MTDKEILAIVQARIGGKQLEKHKVLAWADWKDVLQNEALNFEEYEYRVKPENNLPKTWKDYCRANGVVENYLQCQMPFIGSGVCSETHLYSDAFVAFSYATTPRHVYQLPPPKGRGLSKG